jgi:hypothetical protein
MPRPNSPIPCGRAEPAPPRGGPPKGRWPCGETPGDSTNGVFSEGRALRVRSARPYASPGYGMITEERTNGRWPNREMLRSSANLSRGRAEPAPPGMDSIARPNACRGVSLHDLGRPVARGPMPTCLGQTHPFLPGVRSPPLRGVDHPRGDGLAGKRPGIALMAFSRRDALCASARYGRRNGKALRWHRCFYDKLVAETGQHLGLA